ncbi:hypothetical protein RRG08_067174 [Elysia crispata]|uniref:Uncharacterized protein n=1 Tax=Elysia crispata TaxID=231223 RepID=A0AAE1EAR5_9GAST|nr:hypothetical protein RRG08_067174 [Elysia crispata]
MTEVGRTAQQFTERLDRMLSTPDISLITSQGTPRPTWPKMVSELWLLPSTVYLPMRLSGLKETTLHGLRWNNSLIKEILQHSKRDGQMVKSLTVSLVSREEEERHQRNLNENEQLKKQIAEWTCHVSHLHRLCLHATHLK